jgi:hypothetical protein
MTSRKDLQLAYGLAIVLFVVGVVSYAYTAFSAKPPEEPVRIMYKSVAGKVLFGHKIHTTVSGYGIACYDCHHHPPEDESALRACGDCHDLPPEKGALPESCLECHATDEIEGTDATMRSKRGPETATTVTFYKLESGRDSRLFLCPYPSGCANTEKVELC